MLTIIDGTGKRESRSKMSDSLFLPLQFNGNLSRWTWVSRYQIVSILDFTRVRMMEVVGGNNGSYKMWKAPIKLSP